MEQATCNGTHLYMNYILQAVSTSALFYLPRLTIKRTSPIVHMVSNDLRRLIRCEVTAYGFHEITFRIYDSISESIKTGYEERLTHQIEVDAVINEVVLSWLDIVRCREVHPVLFARLLDVFPVAS